MLCSEFKSFIRHWPVVSRDSSIHIDSSLIIAYWFTDSFKLVLQWPRWNRYDITTGLNKVISFAIHRLHYYCHSIVNCSTLLYLTVKEIHIQSNRLPLYTCRNVSFYLSIRSQQEIWYPWFYWRITANQNVNTRDLKFNLLIYCYLFISIDLFIYLFLFYILKYAFTTATQFKNFI